MAGPNLSRLSTGIDGLDEVLHGGLPADRSYLVRGAPGTGKTILGFHFLTAGAKAGETVLFINLEEPTGDVRQNAASLGFDLAEVSFLDLSPTSEFFAEDQSYSIFESESVEQDPIRERIRDRVADVDPDRVFLDPVTQFRYLASDDYQFRKEVISLMRYLKESDATVLFTSQQSESTPDDDLQFLADGIIELGRPNDKRTVSVPKLRGSDRLSGTHSVRIDEGGLSVYPLLVPGDHTAAFETEQIRSGVDSIDELLGGGIERGTISVVSGPTGVGKTTTGTLFLQEAAKRGENAAVYHFEETARTFRHRCESIGIPISDLEADGSLAVEEIEALERSPEEFAAAVRTEVERNDVSVVMLDGIEGYKLSIQGREDELTGKLHALGRYLKNMGVTVILIDEIDYVTGPFQATNAGISYLADNVVFLRHVEIHSELRKVIGVLKKRIGTFEETLREFDMTDDGIQVGQPLTGVDGLLQGNPVVRAEQDADE